MRYAHLHTFYPVIISDFQTLTVHLPVPAMYNDRQNNHIVLQLEGSRYNKPISIHTPEQIMASWGYISAACNQIDADVLYEASQLVRKWGRDHHYFTIHIADIHLVVCHEIIRKENHCLGSLKVGKHLFSLPHYQEMPDCTELRGNGTKKKRILACTALQIWCEACSLQAVCRSSAKFTVKLILIWTPNMRNSWKLVTLMLTYV